MAENNETVMNNENEVSSELEALLKEQLNDDTTNVPEATNVVEESNNEITNKYSDKIQMLEIEFSDIYLS